MIPTRDLGTTGLRVSALGLGAGQVGDARLSEDDAGRLLNTALDLGVTLVDTARGYGLSEERIGRHLAHRRKDFVLSTKVGYGVEGEPDWTAGCVRRGIDQALGRLRTDVIDVVLLHSCGEDRLRDEALLSVLDQARQAGKIRAAGYSGENQPLGYAVASGRFGVVECSVNFCDQRVLDEALPAARGRGLGLIAKRPIANAPWRHGERPAGQYVEAYWDCWKAMGDRSGRPPLGRAGAALHGVPARRLGRHRRHHAGGEPAPQRGAGGEGAAAGRAGGAHPRGLPRPRPGVGGAGVTSGARVAPVQGEPQPAAGANRFALQGARR
ncbi:MAG: aldo/keto reductase [Anaeromyxobacter sp.]